MNRAILAALCASLILPAAHLLGAPTPDSSTIGQNQGVQFPIAEAYIEVEAADLMRHKASALFDLHPRSGGEVNMAKYLAIKASWQAAEACIQFHGGFGFAGEYEVERKLRETRLYQVVPMSTNGILSNFGEHPLGLPRWF